jgi:hypothetical protein
MNHPARVDFYAPIHKAYRAFMSDTLVRLGRIDLDDAAETESTVRQTIALLASMRAHIKHEDGFMHPAIAATGRVPASAMQHEEHLTDIATTEAMAASIFEVPRSERDAIAHRLYHRLSRLVAENFEHMLDEEIDNNSVLWAHYTDEEIIAVHDALVAAIDPPVFMEIMGWMLPALTPRELAQVMQATRHGAPPPVFEALMSMLAESLTPVRWRKLRASLQTESGELKAGCDVEAR